jgi:shikimate kinase
MNVCLIGYRGTGKSAVAKIIARRTGLTLKDLDAMIVETAGQPIPQIVADHGWERFRDLESRVLEQVAGEDGQVLDCGGGVILREQNRRRLAAAGPVFWLQADVTTISGRIAQDGQRPSLTGKSFLEEIEEVLRERAPLYLECSDHVIDTVDLSPQQAAAEIIRIAGLSED